jgi:hypothetical protein
MAETDFDAMQRMLAQAKSAHDYQTLDVRVTDRRIEISTGPDDAAAVFRFGRNGRLLRVSVVEAHPEFE